MSETHMHVIPCMWVALLKLMTLLNGLIKILLKKNKNASMDLNGSYQVLLICVFQGQSLYSCDHVLELYQPSPLCRFDCNLFSNQNSLCSL